MLRIYDIRHNRNKPNFIQSSEVDQEILDIIPNLKEKIKLATSNDVAVVIETIASTFSIAVPNPLGLAQYFKILEAYPLVFLNECMDKLIREFKYPRLPLPKEFVDRMDGEYSYHTSWLQRLCDSINIVDNK
jgi:hypothetical protein